MCPHDNVLAPAVKRRFLTANDRSSVLAGSEEVSKRMSNQEGSEKTFVPTGIERDLEKRGFCSKTRPGATIRRNTARRPKRISCEYCPSILRTNPRKGCWRKRACPCRGETCAGSDAYTGSRAGACGSLAAAGAFTGTTASTKACANRRGGYVVCGLWSEAESAEAAEESREGMDRHCCGSSHCRPPGCFLSALFFCFFR
jgi:hypothetical protein